MTPYEIDVLLHYYARVCDHPDIERDPPVWGTTIEAFIEADLLKSAAESCSVACYAITERGRAYCEALQCVPLPVRAWVTPTQPEHVIAE